MRHKSRIEDVIEKVFIVLAVPLVLLLMSGVFCGCAAQTFRFEPTEPQKEAADGTSRLAAGGAVTGNRPFSPMAKEMSRMASTLTAYMGTPSAPIDIMPFLEEEANAWAILEKQRDGYKFISKILGTSGQKVTEQFAAIIERVSADPDREISVEDLLPTLYAIADSQEILLDVASKYEIPEDVETTEDVIELIAKIKGIVETASVDAARRPTGRDISESLRDQAQAVNEEAQNWVGTVSGIADEWGLGGVVTGLLGAAGIGGVALRGRSKVKKVVADADDTTVQKDIEIAKLKGENDSLYDQVRDLSKKLAEAPSSLPVIMESTSTAAPQI